MKKASQNESLVSELEKGDGTQLPKNKLNKCSVPLGKDEGDSEGVRARRKKSKPFRLTLEKILSTEVLPKTVAEAVLQSPLGNKITYQEALLLAQVIKACNGDTQAATFIRDTSGNNPKDKPEEKEHALKFEDL